VTELLEQLGGRIKSLAGDWTKYSVMGSFLLYVLGYLALRFHLTAIGIGTDLAVLDERYLFSGTRCFVYLVSLIPSIVLIAIPMVVVAWAVAHMVPGRTRTGLARILSPNRLALVGIAFALFMIQFVMRQCFLLSNLLLSERLPGEPKWLVKLLVDDRMMPLFFAGMVAACGLTLFILLTLYRQRQAVSWFSRALLTFLVAVQILLLPVNYGVLVADKSLPRVSMVGKEKLAEGSAAWLVWEGKEGTTFLVRDHSNRRSLVTLRRSDIERTEIVGFDRIIPTLFDVEPGGHE